MHPRLTNIRLDGWFATAILWLGAAAVGPLGAAETRPLVDDAAAADASFFPPPPPPETRAAGDARQDAKDSEAETVNPASRSSKSNRSADEHQMWLVSTRQLSSAPRNPYGAPYVQRY
ncbi:MAG TPA: hypothetical protein VHB99_15070, partial [Pirellulales bacterium]|nr:hypothetical protein [Pirellulales bacterium]